MKERTHRSGIMAGLLVVAGVCASGQLAAQRIPPPPDAPRFMVPFLHSPVKGLGGDAADAIRSRLRQDFSSHDMYVITKNDQQALLEASGYKTDTAYDITTNRLLANNLRADEFLDGTVTKTDDGYRLESRMVLTRNAAWQQPLPVAEGKRLLDMSTLFSHSLEDARKQLGDERKCEMAIRDSHPDSAVGYARAAIAAYPKSTLGRICLAQAMADLKRPSDSVAAVADQVLAMDPNSQPALLLLGNALVADSSTDSAVKVFTQLVTLDPTNAALQEQLVTIIAQAGHPEAAIPIIDTAVKRNPGDPRLMRLRFLLLLSTKDYKTAITAGEDLLATDTAATDTLFFRRLAAAYAADSQPQKAAEAAAKGVQKFPNNAGLHALYANALRTAGQNQLALEQLNLALAADPKVERGYYLKALTELDLNQPDSAVASLKLAMANGESAADVGQILSVVGNRMLKHADTTQADSDYARTYAFLNQADSIATSPNSKLLVTVTAYKWGELLAKNNPEKSCEKAKKADELFTTVQINAPEAAAANKEIAGSLIQGASQYGPYVQQQIKAFCKGG